MTKEELIDRINDIEWEDFLCLHAHWATISILILATRLSPRYSDSEIYQKLSVMVST